MSKKRSFGDPYNIKLNTSETEDKLNQELKEYYRQRFNKKPSKIATIEFSENLPKNTWTRDQVYKDLLKQNPHLNSDAKKQLKDWVQTHKFTADEISSIINGTFRKKVIQTITEKQVKRKTTKEEREAYKKQYELNLEQALRQLQYEQYISKVREANNYNKTSEHASSFQEAMALRAAELGLKETDLKKLASKKEFSDIINNWKGTKSYSDFRKDVNSSINKQMQLWAAGIVAAPIIGGAVVEAIPFLAASPWLAQAIKFTGKHIVMPAAKSIAGTTVTQAALDKTNLDKTTKQRLSTAAGIMSGGGINIPSLLGTGAYLGTEYGNDYFNWGLSDTQKIALESAIAPMLLKPGVNMGTYANIGSRLYNTAISTGLGVGTYKLAEDSPYGQVLSLVLAPTATKFSDRFIAPKFNTTLVRMQQASKGNEGTAAMKEVISDFNWRHPWNLEYSPTKSGKYYDFSGIRNRLNTQELTMNGMEGVTNSQYRTVNYNPETYAYSTLLTLQRGTNPGLREYGQAEREGSKKYPGIFSTDGNFLTGEYITNPQSFSERLAYSLANNSGRWSTRGWLGKVFDNSNIEGVRVQRIKGNTDEGSLDPTKFKGWNPDTGEFFELDDPRFLKNPLEFGTVAGRGDIVDGNNRINTKGYRMLVTVDKNDPTKMYKHILDVYGMGSGSTKWWMEPIAGTFDASVNPTITMYTEPVKYKTQLSGMSMGEINKVRQANLKNYAKEVGLDLSTSKKDFSSNK